MSRLSKLGLFLALTLTLLPMPSAQAAEAFRLVVNKANPVASLRREQLARYFLRKSTQWPSGEALTAIDLRPSSPARVAFSRVVLGKTIAEVSAYWQQQIFTGRGVPPVEKESEAQVIAAIGQNAWAIGYVGVDTDVSGVKVVEISD